MGNLRKKKIPGGEILKDLRPKDSPKELNCFEEASQNPAFPAAKRGECGVNENHNSNATSKKLNHILKNQNLHSNPLNPRNLREVSICVCARFALLLVLVLAIAFVSCKDNSASSASSARDNSSLKEIRVGTLYSPISFFILRGDTLGYDYDRVNDFARSRNIKVKFVVARSMSSLIQLIDHDSIDLIACQIPITAEYRNHVIHCGAVNETYQVLVQPKSVNVITDVTGLVGKDVYVEKDSKFESRLINLNSELGGGIRIHTLQNDTLMPEDMLKMVNGKKLPLTITDSDIAEFNLSTYDSIDISLKVSFPQRSSWAVAPDNKQLADVINRWNESAGAQAYSKVALQHYYDMSRAPLPDTTATPTEPAILRTPAGAISPYDELFKKYARQIHWDWRLLAAIAYVESEFNPRAVSWAGARGIMQLMPGTAKGYGVDAGALSDPETSVRVAAQVLKELEQLINPRISGAVERRKFILAAYNAGIGHIYDAIELARKYELQPNVWDGNVEEAVLWKMSPKYYNDSVCRFGYLGGKETVQYVVKVEQCYQHYQNKFKR